MPSPGIMTERMSLFIATGLVRTKQSLDFDERIKAFTVTLPCAVNMVFSGKIIDAKTITGILMLDEIYRDKKLFKEYIDKKPKSH